MKAQFRIRDAGADDVENVITLERRVAEAPHWAKTDYLGMLEAEANRMVGRCLLVAELYKDGAAELVGFAVGRAVKTSLDAVGELESVVVAPEARRGGVGQALCEAVIRWCGDEGADEVELEVRSANAGAIELYRRLGFVEEGLRRGYYRDPSDDAVLMRIKVSG